MTVRKTSSAISQPKMATFYKCRLCLGKKRVGAGIFASGDLCLACEGQGKTTKRQHECMLCNAKGYTDSGLIGTKKCVACNGICYLTAKQHACKRCLTKGKESGSFFSTACSACKGSRYVNGEQRDCLMCHGERKLKSGLLGMFSRSCPACEGIGLVVFTQYHCRRCEGTGSVGNVPCPLCEGRCYTKQDHLKCPKCNGDGIQSGWISSEECQSCARKGFIFVKPNQLSGLGGFDLSDTDSSDSDDTELEITKKLAGIKSGSRKNKKSGLKSKSALCSQLATPYAFMGLFLLYYIWRSGILGFFSDTT